MISTYFMLCKYSTIMFENRKRLRKGYSFTIPLKDLNENRKQICTWRFYFIIIILFIVIIIIFFFAAGQLGVSLLPGCCKVSIGEWCPTFRDNVVGLIKKGKNVCRLTFRPLAVGHQSPRIAAPHPTRTKTPCLCNPVHYT
jgi:hypothetical protein